MTKIVELTQGGVLAFISSSPLVIIRASTTPKDFNQSFAAEFERRYPGQVKFGWFRLSSIDMANPLVRFLVDSWLKGIGQDSSGGVLPAYYLFRQGVLVGMHHGSLEWSEDRFTVGVGSAASLSALLLGQEYWGKLFTKSLEVGPAKRLADFFAKVLSSAETRARSQQKGQSARSQAQVLVQELRSARDILGVGVGASSQEIRSAHRKLASCVHPDRHGGDAHKEKRANELMAQLNSAHDLLLKLVTTETRSPNEAR